MKPLIWIIDEEWADYELETQLLQSAFPGCDIRHSTYEYEKDLAAFGKNADAVIAQVYAELPASVIAKLERCKIIAVYGGGYDRVDTVAARQRNIAVTNVSGYCAEDLADYVLAAIFYSNKHIASLSTSVSNGRWGAQAVAEAPRRISDSVLHIIGFGRIGKTVAARAQGLGLKVTAFDPNVDRKAMEACGVSKTSWEDGLAKADFVSINAILTPETTGLLSYHDFTVMSSKAWLINTARGRIIVEADLIRALDEGLIAGAVLDVIANEPPTNDEAIFKAKNCLVTPHVSYISVQSYEELKRRAAGNVITHLNGGVSKDVVNV